MEHFCLVLLGEESNPEESDEADVQFLQHSFSVLSDEYLLRTGEANPGDSVPERPCSPVDSSDHMASVLDYQHKEFFAVVVSQQLQRMSGKASEVLSQTQWMSSVKWKHLCSEISGILTLDVRENDDDDDSSMSSCDEKDDDMADHIHNLADNLQDKEGSLVAVYWILPSEREPSLRYAFMKPWRKWLTFSVVNTSSEATQKVYPIVVWRGSISFLGTKGKPPVSIPGFVMTRVANRVHKDGVAVDVNLNIQRGSDFIATEPPGYCDNKFLMPEIQILRFVEKNSVPLFMLLPIKLKLHMLCQSQKASQNFMELLKKVAEEGVGCLACLSLESSRKATKGKRRNKKAWINHAKSVESFSKTRECSVLEELHDRHCTEKRLCLVSSDGKDGADVFVFRQPDAFNGKLQEELVQISSCSRIIQDCEADEGLCLPDLTGHLLDTEGELADMLANDMEQDIEKSKTGRSENTVCSKQLIRTLMTTSQRNSAQHRKSIPLPGGEVFLNFSSTADASCDCRLGVSVAPEDWPERHWLIDNDPVELAAREAKKKAPIPTEDVLSMDIKEILKKFRPDGRPARDDLSPLRPATKGKASNQTDINTTEDIIRESTYPEALLKKYHGVEYCLDAYDSLAEDIQLASIQISVVRQETLSSCTAPSMKRMETTRDIKRVTEAMKTGKGPATRSGLNQQRPPQTRSLKRQTSPELYLTSKATKRKRKESPIANDNKELPSQEAKKSGKETRSQRHKRRLRQVVEKTLEEQGIHKQHELFSSCSERLYSLSKSFVKDLKSSHGLNEEMKRLARCNVEQVISFEKTRVRTT